jgi:preprotein translocase subunit YajC
MKKFKVGDRVIYTEDGLLGVVVEVHNDGYCQIRWDKEITTNDNISTENYRDIKHATKLDEILS